MHGVDKSQGEGQGELPAWGKEWMLSTGSSAVNQAHPGASVEAWWPSVNVNYMVQ